jgi:transposase InsO family protein
MAYSNIKSLANTRGKAILTLKTTTLPLYVVANKYGVHRTTIWRWLKKWERLNSHVSQDCSNRPKRRGKTSFCANYYTWLIPTLSSRPLTCPHAITKRVVERTLALRRKLKRCAEVVHHYLLLEGVCISLSSVRRIFKRHHQYDRKKYEKKLYRRNIKRPKANSPGDLVQIDTVHLVSLVDSSRKYLTTVIDLYTRMAYVTVHSKLSQIYAIQAVLEAQEQLGFKFKVVQSDNGAEFGGIFKQRLEFNNIQIRHSRPHRPNDNAHIERFNRTLRQECVGHYSCLSEASLRKKIRTYLDFYNTKRVHLSLQYRTPREMLRRW